MLEFDGLERRDDFVIQLQKRSGNFPNIDLHLLYRVVRVAADQELEQTHEGPEGKAGYQRNNSPHLPFF